MGNTPPQALPLKAYEDHDTLWQKRLKLKTAGALINKATKPIEKQHNKLKKLYQLHHQVHLDVCDQLEREEYPDQKLSDAEIAKKIQHEQEFLSAFSDMMWEYFPYNEDPQTNEECEKVYGAFPSYKIPPKEEKKKEDALVQT